MRECYEDDNWLFVRDFVTSTLLGILLALSNILFWQTVLGIWPDVLAATWDKILAVVNCESVAGKMLQLFPIARQANRRHGGVPVTRREGLSMKRVIRILPYRGAFSEQAFTRISEAATQPRAGEWNYARAQAEE
jgi:hypothetical protein